VSVDDLVRGADEKYDFWEVDFGHEGLVRFGNPMRLAREAREGVAEAFQDLGKLEAGGDEAGSVEGDVVDVCRRLFRHACIQGDWGLLARLCGEDAALWSEVLIAYMQAVKLGEASPSVD